MNKFLSKISLFAALLMSYFLVGLALPNTSSNRSIDYALLQKHERLRGKESKIILTGGSNVLFGYDSKFIEDKLHKTTVNHAIHAGYGMKYILEDAEQFVKKGDIVIFSPEYSHFLGNTYLGREPLLFSLTAVPGNLKLISPKQFLNVSPYVPQFATNKVKSFILTAFNKQNTLAENEIGVYSEGAINSNGDNYTHWNKTKADFEFYKFEDSFNTDALEFLKSFQDKIERKGAKFMLTYPSLCQSMYSLNKDIIIKIDGELSKANINVIGKPLDFIFPDSAFFDTPYHLNGFGVKQRSFELVSIFKKNN